MSDGNTVAPAQDPREILRGRITEPKPVAVSLTREGDRILGRYLQVERRQTKYGEKFAVILADADVSVCSTRPSWLPATWCQCCCSATCPGS
jgi:hypothetical protein